MATKMDVMVFLVTALALGTPFVCARRDLLTLGNLQNALSGQTVTLLDIPGLRITSRTEAPSGGIPNIAAILGGNGPPPTISISDRIEGTWLAPVTFTSTTELPTNIISSILQKLQGGPGVAPNKTPVPTTVHMPLVGPASGLNIPPFQFPAGFPKMKNPGPLTGTTLAAADDTDDLAVATPDVNVAIPSPTTVGLPPTTVGLPGFTIPVPQFPFPFASPSPSPPLPSPPAAPRHPEPSSSPPAPRHPQPSSPPAPRHATPSPQHRSSNNDSSANSP